MKKLELVLVTSGIALVSVFAGFAGISWFTSYRQQQQTQSAAKKKKEEQKYMDQVKELLLMEKRDEAIAELERILKEINAQSFEALIHLTAETAEDVEKNIKYSAKLKAAAKTDLEKLVVDLYEAAKTNPNNTHTILMEVLTRYPNNTLVLLEAISLYFATQQLDKARECCDRIISNNNCMPDTVKAMFCKALSFAAPQEREKKMEQLKQALTLYPKFVGALLERAQMYAETNRFQEAMTDIKRVLDVNPKVSKARLVKAAILVAQKKHDEAVEEVNIVIKETPEEIEAYQTLATIYSTGKRDMNKALGALDSLVQALVKSKQSPEKSAEVIQFVKLLKANVYMYFGKFEESVQASQTLLAEVQSMPQQASVVNEQIEFCLDVKNCIEKYTPLSDLVAKQEAPYTPFLTKELLRSIQLKQLDPKQKSVVEMQEWSELVSGICYLALAGSEDIINVVSFSQQLKYMLSNQQTEYMNYLSNNAYILYAWVAEMIKNMDSAFWLTDQYIHHLKTLMMKADKEKSNVFDLVIQSLENVE